jgi:hypothetical protein
MATRTMWGPVITSSDPSDPANWGFGVGQASGIGPVSTISAATGQLTSSVSNSVLHPDHPLFWLAGLLGVMFGAIGFNAHARVGPARGGVDVGKA